MPKILPTFAAIAIVGVCIAFNTMRYPIVWEMVGPKSQALLSEKKSPATEIASSAKTESPASAAQNPSSVPNAAPAADPQPIAKENEKPEVPKAVPITLPKPELATAEAKQEPENTEMAGNNNAPAAEENLVEPSRQLVPVASDAFSAGVPGVSADEVRRLPPLGAEIATPADRYAAEYPPTSIPIYPSTGK